MAKTSFSASGHLAQSADADPKGSGTAGETLAVGNVVYLKAADSKLWKYAASAEATCAGIVGVITTGGDADASVEFAQSGDSATGLSGLTAGTEYWAKSDGSLAAFSGVVAAEYTRPIGVATSTTALQCQIGDVIQKPAA